MGVEGSEEAGYAAGGVAASEDTGVARLPGEEAGEEGDGDRDPCPENGGDAVWFDVTCEAGGEVGDSVTETAEGYKAEEES